MLMLQLAPVYISFWCRLSQRPADIGFLHRWLGAGVPVSHRPLPCSFVTSSLASLPFIFPPLSLLGADVSDFESISRSTASTTTATPLAPFSTFLPSSKEAWVALHGIASPDFIHPFNSSAAVAADLLEPLRWLCTTRTRAVPTTAWLKRTGGWSVGRPDGCSTLTR